MTDMKDHPQKNLNFSQRYGYEPLPAQMRLEEISDDLRREVWNVLRGKILGYTGYDDFRGSSYFSSEGVRFVERVLGKFFKKPEDEISTRNVRSISAFFKDTVLKGKFNDFLRLLEDIINDPNGTGLAEIIQNLFEEHAASYRLDKAGFRWQFYPRGSAEQGEAVQQALSTIQDAGMDGAASHLRQAAEHMRMQQYADSIADSIHAVESVAKQIDRKANKTLGPALSSLAKSGVLKNQALKNALLKLYGYTNTEQGIRHALLDKDAPEVGLDEALFMFGACASFAAYLVEKHRQQ